MRQRERKTKKEKERKKERETRNKGGENAKSIVFDPVFGGKEYAVWLARAHNRDDARMVGTTPVPMMIASRFDSELYASSRRFTSSRFFLFVCACVSSARV